jgi:photosystem II stability/assembly factor-like uncharacterized protein
MRRYVGVAGVALATLCVLVPVAAKAPDSYPLAPRSLVLDAVLHGTTIVAAADRGLILHSTDDGKTWTQTPVPSPEPVMLTALAFQGAHGFAVGHDTSIFTTDDDGKTWTLKHRAPELETPLFAIWAENAQHAIAVGAYGLIEETADGGATWTERRISEDEQHLYAIVPAGDSLYAVGEQGSIFLSHDRGATWEAEPSPYHGTWFGITALKDGGLLIYGLRGNLFRTDNAGASWTKIETETDASLLGALQRADGSVIVVGLSGMVLTSTDGHHFTAAPLANREALGGAFEGHDGQTMVFGEKGVHALPARPTS